MANRLAGLILVLFLSTPAAAQEGSASEAALREEARRVPVVAEAIKKTVLVQIRFRGKDVPIGSGGVISSDGYAVTCAHVVEVAPLLQIRIAEFSLLFSDGTRREAKLLGKNSRNDIALLKVEAKDLSHFTLSRDRRPARRESVIALGYPAGNVGDPLKAQGKLGPHPSVAIGRVTDPSRRFMVGTVFNMKYYPDAIESDTPVFKGNSGGPLVNERGELVGLNAAISMGGKTFTLSVVSIAKCFDEMKAGRNVEGETGGAGLPRPDIGESLWDALGFSGKKEPARRYLHEGFRDMARVRKGGVLPLYRGNTRIGYATVLDKEGHLAASERVLKGKGLFSKLADKVEDGLKGNPSLLQLWKRTREMFGGREGAITAQLPSGKRVRVRRGPTSKKFGLTRLDLASSKNDAKPIPRGSPDRLRPGHWVAVLGSADAPLRVGLLSAGRHTVSASMKFPLTLGDWVRAWTDDELDPKSYVDIILFDAKLEGEQLGTPLCDSRGRMLGITIFHPARGTSYAAPLAAVFQELGLVE